MKLIECPRDAMQGMHNFIPTDLKAEYINLLLQVGFDTIDFGSFVSAKAIPQMQDTAQVLSKLDLSKTKSKLLAIIANQKGLEQLINFEEITYAGFPFSVSETFQQRNTNKGMMQSLVLIDAIAELCLKNNKKPVIYLSMGFGNPYGDDWNIDLLSQWAEELVKRNIEIISIADTVGMANSGSISEVFSYISQQFKNVEWGLHLHTKPNNWQQNVEAAYSSGCRRIDSAIRGFGGCPMAQDSLTGNLATENVIDFLVDKGVMLNLDMLKLKEAISFSHQVFN